MKSHVDPQIPQSMSQTSRAFIHLQVVQNSTAAS
jgi:hypothetical protein